MPEFSLPPQNFLHKDRVFALVGASASWEDHAYHLFLALEKKGYNVIPLHPSETNVCGVPSFPDFTAIPEATHVIFSSEDPEISLYYLKKMRDIGLNQCWFEEGLSTPEMEEFARIHFFEVVKEVNLLQALQKIS